MATTTTVNIRIDSDVKAQMEKVCKEIGISMSAAFKIFARKVAREHRIPFAVNADPFYSEENMARLKQRIDDVRSGRAVLTEHELIEA